MRRRLPISRLVAVSLSLIALATFACAPSDAPRSAEAQKVAANQLTDATGETEAAPDTAVYCADVTDSATVRANTDKPGWVRSFDCPFHGGRAMLVEARADSESIVRSLRVTAPAEGGTAQELRVIADDPFPVSDGFLRSVDLDGDGYRDLMLMIWYGATGNAGHAVWLWDARAGRFAYDAGLSNHTNLRPVDGGCWETQSVGGHAGRIYTRERLCRVSGRVTVVRSERQDFDYDARVYIRTIREPRGDTLAAVRVDTLPDEP